ncbi:MAG: hypothetical protein WC384_09875 [Prolixibacteraceae bacterium]|jgi:hypothetical protein
MKTITFLLCIFFLFNADIQAQDVSNDSIQNLFLEQISLYPQEKIYVHTDKASYISGETIWLRVHLVDALLLKQANASRYVYVELINPLADVVNRVMLHADSMGFFYGNVTLDETLPEGNYTLRAYTRFMQNQGEDYFFRKSVYVSNLLSAELSPEIDFRFEENKVKAEISFLDKAEKKTVVPDGCKLFIDGCVKGEGKSLSFEPESAHFSFDLTKAQNQPVFLLETTYKGRTYNRFFVIPQAGDAFDVSFFPEGGHTPLQTDIRIAFKALKKNGLHENVKGTVFDDTGKEWSRFESLHLGMGQFRMHYLPGRTYHVVCTNEQNVSKRFDLPVPEPGTLALKARWSGGNLGLTMSRPSDYVLPPGVHLVAHIRGAVLYSQPWTDTRGYLFEKDFFPAGIIHFLLIDKDRNILSERLVFSSQSSTFANVYVTPDKQSYQSRGKISLSIKVTDEYEAPLSGNFSLSVVDKRDVAIDTTSSIISTLLLTSELKGYIESPMSYLQKDELDSNAALDVLMMTQGWRRYNVPEILKGNLQKEQKYQVESNRQFSGKLTGVFSALRDGSISLIAVRDSVIGTLFTKPEKDGRFVFKDVDYPDSTRYIVQALTKKGSSRAFIEMDSIEALPKVGLSPLNVAGSNNNEGSSLDKVNEEYVIENGLRLINLAEVVVNGQRINRRKTESPYYSVASSFVLATEEIEKANFMNVFDLLRRLPGVTTSGSEVFYRRATPLLILDNVPTENFDYSMLNVNDISDAFVSPATSVMPIFGARAANGAIVINTKKGFVEKNSLNKNMQVITPIGYQQHVEFYSPAYETEEQRKNTATDLRSTIYWNPCVRTDSTGIAHLSFYSADLPSQYGLVIEGVSSFGHLIYSSKEAVTVEQ